MQKRPMSRFGAAYYSVLKGNYLDTTRRMEKFGQDKFPRAI